MLWEIEYAAPNEEFSVWREPPHGGVNPRPDEICALVDALGAEDLARAELEAEVRGRIEGCVASSALEGPMAVANSLIAGNSRVGQGEIAADLHIQAASSCRYRLRHNSCWNRAKR
jgi:hypothetical protein